MCKMIKRWYYKDQIRNILIFMIALETQGAMDTESYNDLSFDLFDAIVELGEASTMEKAKQYGEETRRKLTERRKRR